MKYIVQHMKLTVTFFLSFLMDYKVVDFLPEYFFIIRSTQKSPYHPPSGSVWNVCREIINKKWICSMKIRVLQIVQSTN